MNVNKNIKYSSDALADYFRTNRVRWDQFYESERVMLDRLAIDSGTRVLDLGCGCGGLGLALKERFGVQDYTGVEIHDRAAEIGRTLNPKATILNQDVLSVSGDELPESSFDLVVSLSCIDWNICFSEMLLKSFRWVKPDGFFVASFRLTDGIGANDPEKSYQYINFEGVRTGELAPYVVQNIDDLLQSLLRLGPEGISGYGYWGKPSATAVTPYDRLCFAVLAVQRMAQPASGPIRWDLDLPEDLLAASRFSDGRNRRTPSAAFNS